MKHMRIIPLLLAFVSLFALSGCKCACTTPTAQTAPGPVVDLQEITVRQLRQGYQEGRFTVVEVVQNYLNRIEAIDRSGPTLNAVVAVNPDALKIAAELDAELKAGRPRGPLHGIPVLLKDNIDTRDPMPTTAGATALRSSYARNDSGVAKKLREAGAVILGKANLSEWANFRASYSSSGWSGVGGQTRNPYVLDRNPCGSSSGSGAAVAASLCAMAIGTETNGSIVCPSTNNGIVGIKPTVGLVSRSGIVPISFTQDTAGPMARTVEDAAVCLGVLAGVDPADAKTAAAQGRSHADYTPFLRDARGGEIAGDETNFTVSRLPAVSHPAVAAPSVPAAREFAFRAMLAAQYEASGRPGDAELAYDEALRQGGDSLPLRVAFARFLLAQAKPERALEVSAPLPEQGAHAFDRFALRGKALYRLGRWQEAVDELLRANALYDSDISVLNALGLSLLRLGNPQEARKALAASLKIKAAQPDIDAVLKQMEAP